jgi:hypothetical protein
MTDKENKITKLLNSDEWQELTRLQMEWEEQVDKEYDEAWNALDYDTQLKMFYSVVKRLVKGELRDKGTYRWVLYDVFGFQPDAYALGMQCGFLELHNSIYSQEDFQAHVEHLAKKKYHLENPSFDDRPVAEFSPGFTVEKKDD